jgi:hypothetical protein
MQLEFAAEVVYWRGPSPLHFIEVPEDGCAAIRAIAASVTYGWGVIPVTVRIGDTRFATSLFPRGGRYLVPVKDAVRHAESLAVGDVAAVELIIEPRGGVTVDRWA